MKIPNAIHKFVLHKKKKNMGNMYVQVAIEINRKQTAERACCNSQKNYFSVVYPQKHST